jgi:hypothetical protein
MSDLNETFRKCSPVANMVNRLKRMVTFFGRKVYTIWNYSSRFTHLLELFLTLRCYIKTEFSNQQSQLLCQSEQNEIPWVGQKIFLYILLYLKYQR